MTPTTWDGNNLWNGNMNPVTLVATVVTRKSEVQPSRLLPAISPNNTTNPDKIPTRLITTWTKVKVVMPRIMMCQFRGDCWRLRPCKTGAPGEIRTPDLQLRRLPLYPAELRARCGNASVHRAPGMAQSPR